MKAIYIETTDTFITAYAVWVTQAKKGILVIREAVKLPRVPLYADLCIIDARGYESAISGGYVDVVSNHEPSFTVVGEMKLNRSLHPISPRSVHILKDVSISKIDTHSDECRNREVAETARKTLFKIIQDHEIVIVYGGAIETNAYHIQGTVCNPSFPDPVFPEEHQKGIINFNAVEATSLIDEYFYSYYGDGMAPSTEEKKKKLFKMVCEQLMGIQKHDRFETAERESLLYIARRFYRYGDLDGITTASSEAVEQLKHELFTYNLVEGCHDGDDQIFTWYAPSDMELSAGDRVMVETAYGQSEITVTAVNPSLNTEGHRSVLRKMDDAVAL